jgi:hypothetical protein
MVEIIDPRVKKTEIPENTGDREGDTTKQKYAL